MGEPADPRLSAELRERSDVLWSQLKEPFFDYVVSHGRQPRTAQTYVYGAGFFFKDQAAAGVDPVACSTWDVQSWLSRRSREVSANKVYNDLWSIHTFYEFLTKAGLREDDPTEGLSWKREKIAPVSPFSREEIAAMIEACSHESKRAGSRGGVGATRATRERDRLMIETMDAVGIRVDELCHLKGEDVDATNGLVRIHGKGNKQRTVAPTDAVLAKLVARAEEVGPEGFIFITRIGTPMTPKQVRQILDGIADRAGVKGAHPHRFRTTFAVEMLRLAGGDIQAVQEMLGHDSIETTQRYTSYDKRERALALMRKRS